MYVYGIYIPLPTIKPQYQKTKCGKKCTAVYNTAEIRDSLDKMKK